MKGIVTSHYRIKLWGIFGALLFVYSWLFGAVIQVASAGPLPEKILYHVSLGGGIWSINPDGTDAVELSDHGWFAQYSPGGTKIAFSEWYDDGIWVMDADGSNQRKLTDFGSTPSWSPDESQIVFQTGGTDAVNRRLWIMNADGTDPIQLSDNPADFPHWSPNGSKILYNGWTPSASIWMIESDGSGETLISEAGLGPSWSSDGTEILFTSYVDNRIWIMDADGTNLRSVSTSIGVLASMNPDGDQVVFESSGGLIVTTLDGDETLISEVGYSPDWLVGDTSPPYPSQQPIFSGVGLVPWSEIEDGYATTAPEYFFYVVDAPFGGTLNIFGNFDHARSRRIAEYKVLFAKWDDEIEPSPGDFQELRQSWSNYKWNPIEGEYELFSVGPDDEGIYSVPPDTEDWYLDDLLIQWKTTDFEDGKYTLKLQAFRRTGGEVWLNPSFNNLVLMIDNTRPKVEISQIFYDGEEVDTCAIVEMASPGDTLTFRITAWDNELHLRKYSLRAHYGDNQSFTITSESYVSVPSREWGGVADLDVDHSDWPTTCAYQFRLQGWTRTTDGYKYLQYKEYNKHITILLP